jgi:glutamate synthase (NADPH/NADH) large chain
LRFLIERHLMFTGSGRARAILDNWDTSIGKFIKVMPVDYRRALQEMQTDLDQINLAAGE